MNYITDLTERKALLTRIIPTVPRNGGRWGTKLDWAKYFAANPFDAPLLGYDVRENKPELWNRNNVLARDMLSSGRIKENGHTPPAPVRAGDLLTDPAQRKQLLLEIYPQLPSGPTGSKSWKKWFETHPEQATALGYDIRRNRPKVWAANLRISQQRLFLREALTPQTGPLVPYTVETPQTVEEGVKVLEQKAEIIRDMQHRAEIKELREQIRECESRIELLKAEKTQAAFIILELTIQIRNMKGQ